MGSTTGTWKNSWKHDGSFHGRIADSQASASTMDAPRESHGNPTEAPWQHDRRPHANTTETWRSHGEAPWKHRERTTATSRKNHDHPSEVAASP